LRDLCGIDAALTNEKREDGTLRMRRSVLKSAWWATAIECLKFSMSGFGFGGEICLAEF
jgi:hypothetical protein